MRHDTREMRRESSARREIYSESMPPRVLIAGAVYVLLRVYIAIVAKCIRTCVVYFAFVSFSIFIYIPACAVCRQKRRRAKKNGLYASGRGVFFFINKTNNESRHYYTTTI